MHTNIFSWIRKRQFTLQLFVAIMVNMMVFSQPLSFAINNLNTKQVVPNNFRTIIGYANQTIQNNESNGLIEPQSQNNSKTQIVENKSVEVLKDVNTILAFEKQGIIGKSENLPIDELTDNIFSFELNEAFKQNKEAYLEYEIFGLADAGQSTKSVNDQLATGGTIIKMNKVWSKVREKLNPESIQKGKNFVKFTTLENANYQYMVRNVKMVYEDTTINEPIVFSQSSTNSYNGKIAFSGFISDKTITKISVLGAEYPVNNGVFEVLVQEKEPNASITVSYLDKSGNRKENTIKIKQLLEQPDVVNNNKTNFTQTNKAFEKNVKNTLTLAGAKLEVEDLSLANNTTFSIAGLRYTDLPTLSPEMVNVTADFHGYRMLPHGEHFNVKPAKIHLKYDEKKLPTGYTAKDIKTFYFDNDQRKWLALDKDTLLSTTQEIVSKTAHFTDFINGIIKVPESPETGSYTPTSIKDIKAADPTAGVVSIAPPSPNNMGTLNTSFPIKLPAGRSGMEPELAVSYNSEGGNGWMGLGWDLSIPGVSLDTRWGAPRYDGSIETEIYSMGGGMLTLKDGAEYTNPHRKDNISRTNNLESDGSKRFYPRIEGSYAKVIRHGSNPTNYWWEVTDKTGNKSFYGGYAGSVVNNAVVKTNSGNIAYWGLYRTEDTNGNYVEYIYENQSVSLPGQPGDGGNEFFIKEIKYTKHHTNGVEDNLPNYYKVIFNRDRIVESGTMPNLINRRDIQVNARNGVVQVTKDFLKEIKVSFEQSGTPSQTIRSYKFDYQEHAFFKSQLYKVSEYDAFGDLFYSNTMEYETNGNYGNPGSANDTTPVTNDNFFGSQTSVSVDTPFQGHQTGDLIVLSDPVSVLGSTEMGGVNWGGYIGVGLCSGSNWFTGGANIAGSFSTGGSLSAFMDVNGDNLPDKVYSTEDQGIKYIPNLGNLKFHGSAFNLTSFSNIGRNTADSDSYGGSASLGIATLGGTYNTSKNVTSTYITDTNGDGLVDLVDNGLVKFNETNSNTIGDISFNHDNGSTNTQNTIASGSFNLVNNPNIQITTETREELEDKNPLHDIVKVWVAPRDGTINIASTASLASEVIPPSLAFPTQSNDPFYPDYDGVRLSVQHEGILLSPQQGHLLQPTFTNNNGTPNIATTNISFANVPVTRGQRIFFRVQANYEGTFDRVLWNPVINYTNITNETNVDNISYFNSSAEQGYIVSAKSEVIIPQNVTTIGLTWPALNGVFSDDLTFSIEEGTVDLYGVPTFPTSQVFVYNQTISNNSSIATLNNPGNILTAGRAYRFSVTSNSNVNWRAIDWRPVISMTIPATVTPTQLYPVVNYGIFNRKVNVATSRVAINPAFPVFIRPEIDISPFLTNIPNNTFGVRLIVKNNNSKVILNQLYGIDTNGTGSITPNLNDFELPVVDLTNPIFVEYYTDNVEASNIIQNNPDAIRARIGQVVNPLAPPALINLPTTTQNPLSTRITGVTLQNIAPTTGNFTSAYYINNTTINNKPNIFTIIPSVPLAVRVNLATNGHAAIWVDLNRNNVIEADEFSASSIPNNVHNISINIPSSTPVGLFNVRIIGGRNTPYASVALNLNGGFNNLQNTTIRNYQINVVAPVTGNNPVNDVYCKAGNNPFGTMYRNWGQFAYHGGIVIARGVPLFRLTNGDITTDGTLSGATMVGNGPGIDTPQERNFPTTNPPTITENYGYSATNVIRPIDNITINNALNGTISPGQQACITAWNNSSQDATAQQALADCMSIANESVSNKRFHSLSPVNLQSINNTNNNRWTWQGITDKIRVEPQHISASRLGVPNINKIFVTIPVDVDPGSLANCQFPKIGAVPIIKRGEGYSIAASLGVGGVGFGGNRSYSFNWTELTSMDMNGDRYPDVLTRDNIRYTNGLGALSFDIGNNLGRVTRDETRSWGATASGTFKRAVTGKGFGFAVGKNAPKPTGKPTSDTSFNLGASWNDETPLGFFMDINGDGLPDRIDATGNQIVVNLNLGYGFSPSQTWLQGFQLLSESTNIGGGFGFTYGANAYGGGVSASSSEAITVTNFMDMNDDGLPDLIFNENQYLLNTGNSFVGAGTVNNAIESINNGESLSITATIPICFVFVQTNITLSGGGDNTHSFDKSTYQDINGDGYPDILNADTNNSVAGKFHNIYLSRIGNVNALKKVNTPTGGSWEVAYERVGNTFELPQSKYVVNKIKTFDAFTADNNWSNDRNITTIEYEKPYHDRREREFFGFEKVKVNQHGGFNTDINLNDPLAVLPEIYRYSVQEFHNKNYYLKGAVKKETLFDANNVAWTENKTTYGIYKPDNTIVVAPISGTFQAATNDVSSLDESKITYGSDVIRTGSNTNFICTDLDNSRLFVTPLVSVKSFTEGGTGLKTAVTVMEEFDAHGNIKRYRDYGEQNADVYVSKIEYNPVTVNGQPEHGFPSKIQVFDGDGTTLKRERRAQYNTNGDLERVITKLNGTEDTSVKMEYDPTYGNLSKVIHENSINPVDGSKFFREYTYDDVVHTYPVAINDAFGYSSSSVYNYLFGIPVYTTDMNLQPMRTRIDDRGRPIEITGPYELFVEGVAGGSEVGWTIRFEYQDEKAVAIKVQGTSIDDDNYTKIYNAIGKFEPASSVTTLANGKPHYALTRHFDPEYRAGEERVATANQILTSTLADGFGKPVQVKKMFSRHIAVTSGNTPNATNNKLEWLLAGKAKQDAFGRAIESYYPTTQTDDFTGLATNVSFVPTNAFVYDNTADTVEPTKATYDVLDRTLTTKLPGETEQTTMAYAIDSNRFLTTVTNELGQVQKSFSDVRGRTTQTLQESLTGAIPTNFEYNNIGELLKVTDVASNETLSSYDLAGRRIELLHPDNGITQFVYDKASNLIERKTANLLQAGQKIEYKYTYNRLDEIKYPQNPENNVHYYYGTAGNSDAANDNAVGRLWYHVDATGTQYMKYGKLGELTLNRRSVAVPGDRVYWFQTEWTYDTWNRVKTIKYPDEELVTYKYNKGGELHAMTSEKNGTANKDIICQLGYDKFGQRTYLRYGNGTETTYDYQAERRRLDRMKVSSNTTYGAATTRQFVNNKYNYDALSNVLSIQNNTVAMPTTTQIGGRSWQEYTYDDLNRLTTASGNFVGRNDNGVGFNHSKHTLAMSYDSQHNITSKLQNHETAVSTSPSAVAGTWTQVEQTSYNLNYQDYNTADYNVAGYNYTQPHAPRKIVDQPNLPGCCDAATDVRVKTKTFDYDANGNQTKITQKICTAPEADILRENLWDEENRLRAIDLNPEANTVHPIAVYTYDAGGERIVKQNATSVAVYENALQVGTAIKNDFMLYPSGMLVARPAADGTGALSYTKHYFAGTQRVSSKIGTTTNLGKFLEDWTLIENSSGGAPINLVSTSHDQLTTAETGVNHVYTQFNMPTQTFASNSSFVPIAAFTPPSGAGGLETETYWFHPDHLGSSNYITNFVGEVSQHMEYFAFGETFIEEHKNSHNSPYKFNGKELDEESGYTYYGARYLDMRYSMWISVDPLMYDGTFWAGKHNGGLYNMFNHGSYMYCYQNPVNLIDPNGKQTESITIDGGTIEEVKIVAGKKSGFSWSAFGRGLVKGLVVAVVVVAVVAAVVVAGPVILAAAGITISAGAAATITTVATVAGSVLVSGAVIKSGVELYTKKNIISGETLTTDQASENFGGAVADVVVLGATYGAGKLIPASVAAPEVAVVEAEVAVATEQVAASAFSYSVESGIMGGSFKLPSGEVEILSNYIPNGNTLELTEIVFYPKGAKANELANEFGTRQMMQVFEELKNLAKSAGFDKVRIQYQRAPNSSSAQPGKIIDKVYDCN